MADCTANKEFVNFGSARNIPSEGFQSGRGSGVSSQQSTISNQQLLLSAPEQMKISSCLLHITRDLLPQRLHGRELDLIPHSIEKTDLDFALRRQLDRMKVQQVGLDGKRIGAKGRTIAHIRHGIKALVSH